MSNLLDLVPALDMCLKIPNGEFSDSAFLWIEADDKNVSGRLIRRTKAVKNWDRRTAPAPTLQEIMEEIASIDKIYSVCPFTGETICTNPKYDPAIRYSPGRLLSWSSKRWRDSVWVENEETACEAALRTYLKIKNITVTMRCPECGFWLNKVDKNTKNNIIEDEIFSLSEICPNCKLEFFHMFICLPDKAKNLTEIVTPMGNRWIRNEKLRGVDE
jgi:hypothetical protein